MLRAVAIILVQFITLSLWSQNYANNWTFGTSAGINFNVSPPQTFTSASTHSTIGGSAWSDPNGNLVFYSDGVSAWNSSHTLIPNGTLMGGNSRQVVIVPLPGSQNIYYVFSCRSGLRYSIVDMSLASGQGSVTAKGVQVTQGIPMQDQIAAIPHCNGTDIWIVTHRHQSNDFYTWLFSSTGLNTTPVISTTPFWYGASYSLFKCSPDGRLIASNWNSIGPMCLQSFNKLTGAVTNAFQLSNSCINMEFSPDGSKLYGIDHQSIVTNTLMQWNVCAGSPTAVAASIYTQAIGPDFSEMQLGPNGIIYLGVSNNTNTNTVINAILNPNATGALCNYSTAVITLTTGTTGAFPTFLNGFISQNPPGHSLPSFSFQPVNNLGCYTEQFFVPPSVFSSTTGGACSSSYSVSGIRWDFGDPLSGSSNTSTANNPIHAFPANGLYTVSLIVDYYCGAGSDTITQIVNVNVPCVTVASNSITCASLGSATVSANGGIGPFSYTWLPGSQTGSVATGLNPGTHTVLLHDAGNNITSTATVTFFSPSPFTGSLLATNSLVCHSANNGTAAITNIAGGSGTHSYLWSNGNTTLTSPGVTALSAGSWSVTVTDGLTACTIHSVFVISQPPPLSVQITGPGNIACLQSQLTLTGTATGGTPLSNNGYSLAWVNGPSLNGTTVTTYSTIQSSNGINNYSLTVTDANGCQKVASYSVSVVPTLVLSTSSTSVCLFTTGTITASGANSYTWSTSATGYSMSATPSVTTIYTVTGEAPGCTSSATAQIALKPEPVPLVSANSPLCAGQDLVLQPGTSGTLFAWAGPLSFSSSSSTPTITNSGVQNSGAYNVTVTAANGCTAIATGTVQINPAPGLSATGATVCNGQTVVLSSSSDPGAIYQWNGPNGFNSSQKNPSIHNASIAVAGDYTIKATNSFACTNSSVVNVHVLAPPSLSIQLSSNSLCAQALNGSPNVITFTNSGADSYTLLTGAPLSNSDPTNTTVPVSTNPPYQPTGIATATLLGSNGVCTVALTATFSIVPNPTIGVNSFTPTICAGESFTYTSDGANSYVWNSSTPNYTTWSNGGVAVANPSINSVLTVYGSSLGCNSALLTTTITVNPIPTVSVNPPSAAICKFSTATLQASGTATEFSWLPNINLNKTKGDVITAGPEQNQTYTVIGSALGCTNSAVASVEVLNLPVPTANLSSPTICIGDEITLTGKGGASYEWSGPGNLSYRGSPVTFILDNPAFVGEYTVIATDANGCKGSAKTTINVHPLPQGTLLGNFEGCVPMCERFHYKGQNSEQLSSVWTIGNKTFPQNFSHCFTTPGEYVIKGQVNDQNTRCKTTQSFVVTVHQKPYADFSWNPEKPIEGIENVMLLNNSTGEDQTSWNWYMQHDKSFSSDNENTSYFFQNAGTYPIVCVVENKWGCADTAIKVLTIETDFAIFVPNAFTPNADSSNESFKPVVRGVKKYHFQIYNRWGERLFVTENPEEGWDGSFQSQECKQDSYVWKIVLSNTQGEQKEYAGSVVLIR